MVGVVPTCHPKKLASTVETVDPMAVRTIRTAAIPAEVPAVTAVLEAFAESASRLSICQWTLSGANTAALARLTPPPRGGCQCVPTPAILPRTREKWVNMRGDVQFSSFVADIYDCVAEPARWQSTLQRLCDHFEGLVATLGVLDTTNNQTRFGAACGAPEVIGPLVTKYAADMPFYHVIPRMEIDVPVTMDTIYELAGPGAKEAIYSSPVGREWATPNKVADGLCLALVKQAERIGTLVINTTTDRRPISQRDLNDLALLAPHLRRAVTIGDLFELQMAETGLYRSIVDNLSCAVLIVTAHMRLLYANSLGESLLQAGILCRSPGGTVTFVNPLVQTCVAGTIATGERSEVALGGRGIGMPLVPVACPSVAHILPLCGRNGPGRFQQDAAAAIFIAAPAASPVTAIEAIASLFGLTAAEKRVAGMIAKGMSRAEIALSCGTTDGTVKSQLDAVFDKTQTGSQRELEKLLRDLTPPLNQG